MKKTRWSLMAAVLGILLLLGIGVSAADVEYDSATYINPLYENVLDEEDLVRPKWDGNLGFALENAVSESEYLTTLEEAGKFVREKMKARETEVVVYYRNTEGYYDTLAKEIADTAMLHTGVPDEGDYIRWHWGGWKMNVSYRSTGSYTYMTFTYTFTYHTTLEQEKAVTAKVDEVLDDIITKGMTDYQKIRAIYDYLCENIVYDYVNVGNTEYKLQYTAYAALIQGTSVCQGYANLFYRMILEEDIDTRGIPGTGSGGGHAWNIVELNDLYYNVDATWDAGAAVYTYFLKCNENFPDHIRDEGYYEAEFNALYPMSTTDYTANEVHVHTAGEAVVENAVAATCTEDGSYEEAVYCSVCEAELSRTLKTVEKLGHTAGEAVTENAVAATCTEDGSYEEVVYCSVCEAEISRTLKTLEKLGHTAGEAVTENAVAATCTEDGSYEEVVYCTVCETEISRTLKTLEKLGHTAGEAVTENSTVATCTEDGSYEEVVYCTVCEAEISRTLKTVEKLDHTAGEAVMENSTVATCTEGGSYEEVVYCTVCEAEISRTLKTVEKLDHIWNDGVETIPATATEAGVMTYTCTVCEQTREETIPATGGGDSEESGFTVSVADLSVRAGTTGAVTTVSVENIPADGLGRLVLEIAYDDTVLKLTGAEDLGALGEFTEGNLDANPYIATWTNTTTRSARSTGNEVLVLTFDVLKVEELDTSKRLLSVSASECVDVNGEDLSCEVENPAVDVRIPGDVNGDGYVSGKDLLLLRQYLVEMEVTIDEEAADVNGDAYVSGKDVILMRQYLAEWDVVLQ